MVSLLGAIGGVTGDPPVMQAMSPAGTGAFVAFVAAVSPAWLAMSPPDVSAFVAFAFLGFLATLVQSPVVSLPLAASPIAESTETGSSTH